MEFKGIGKEWDLAEINITDMKQITVFCSDPKQVIAHIYLPDYEITPELKANGNLISKSPEMLQMLKDILYNLENEEEPFDENKIYNLIKEATEI